MTYHIARDGQQQGTFSESDVRNGLSSGQFLPTDLCWAEGMSEWKPLGAVIAASPAPSVAASPVFTPNISANPYAPPSSDIRTNFAARPALASLGQRFGAAMLDGVIGLALAIPALVAIPLMEHTPGSEGPPEVPPMALGLISVTGLLFLILIVYTIYLLSVKGQTLGKKFVGIRIVNNLDDSNAGFVRAFLLRGVVNAIPGAFIPFYGLIDVCFIFGQERRCIHDFIGGTRVIQG